MSDMTVIFCMQGYVRPDFVDDSQPSQLVIEAGRHPVRLPSPHFVCFCCTWVPFWFRSGVSSIGTCRQHCGRSIFVYEGKSVEIFCVYKSGVGVNPTRWVCAQWHCFALWPGAMSNHHRSKYGWKKLLYSPSSLNCNHGSGRASCSPIAILRLSTAAWIIHNQMMRLGWLPG